MGVEAWYGHLKTDELLPLLSDAERQVEQAIGHLEAALVTRNGLARIIRSRCENSTDESRIDQDDCLGSDSDT